MTIYEAFIWELTVAVLPQHRYNMHLLAVDARSQCAFQSKSRPKTRYIITRTKETDMTLATALPASLPHPGQLLSTPECARRSMAQSLPEGLLSHLLSWSVILYQKYFRWLWAIWLMSRLQYTSASVCYYFSNSLSVRQNVDPQHGAKTACAWLHFC